MQSARKPRRSKRKRARSPRAHYIEVGERRTKMTYVSLLLCGPVGKDTGGQVLVTGSWARGHANKKIRRYLVAYRMHDITENFQSIGSACRLCHGSEGSLQCQCLMSA